MGRGPMANLTRAIPPPRRHTYYFLRHAREVSPVYLSTRVDMTAVNQARAEVRERSGGRLSYISFVVQAAARAIARHPLANSSVRHGWIPRIAFYRDVSAKVTFDKEIDGWRAVVSGMVPCADRLGLREIQERIDYYKERPVEEIPELRGLRALHRLPLFLGQILYNRALASFERRYELQGSFGVTSFGHRPIEDVYPIISNTTCFGVGAIKDAAVVRGGKVSIRPMLALTMAFDHRAIDGALAADLLGDVKEGLETIRHDPEDGDGRAE